MASKRKIIRVGAHQLSWGTSLTTTRQILDQMETAKELGCGAFEAFLSGNFGPRKSHVLETVSTTAQKIGLTTIGCAIIRNGIDGDPLSTDETLRRKAVKAIKQYIQDTRCIGSSLLVGPLANVLGKPEAQPPTQAELKAGVETFRQIAETARRNNIRVAIEPLQWGEMPWPNTVQEVLKFISRVEKPAGIPKSALGVLFDIFHALRMEENYLDALKMLLDAGKLFHIHVAGPGRTPPRINQHIDWKKIIEMIQKAKWNGDITIESFGQECDLPLAVVGPGKRPPAREVIASGVETLQKAGL